MTSPTTSRAPSPRIGESSSEKCEYPSAVSLPSPNPESETIKDLRIIIADLSNTIKALQAEIASLKGTPERSNDWTVVTSNKRPATVSPQASHKAVKKKNARIPTEDSRPSGTPATQDPTSSAPATAQAPDPLVTEPEPAIKIPPIFIDLKGKGYTLQAANKIAEKFTGKYSYSPAGKNMRISTPTPEDYKAMRAALHDLEIPHYTFKPSWVLSDKKLVLRGLPADIPPAQIEGYYKIAGATSVKVAQIKSTRPDYTHPLPLYTITFPPDQEEVVTSLLEIEHFPLRLENYRPPRGPPQCFRCQAFGHTRNYCRLPPRCLKCAGDHDTITCEKPKSSPAKCANCQEHHTANYRGCPARQRAIFKPAPPPPIRHQAYNAIARGPTSIPPLMSFPALSPSTQTDPQPLNPPQVPSNDPRSVLRPLLQNLSMFESKGLLDWMDQVAIQVLANPDTTLNEVLRGTSDFSP